MYRKTQTYYKVLAEVDSILSGMEFEAWEPLIMKLLTIRRLAKKHHRLAEMSCNGEGWIRGQRYYAGAIDDWARQEYGYGVKSACVGEDTLIFDAESDKVEAKITALVSQLGNGWTVDFQGDPRGNTVKVSHNGQYVDVNF